MNIRIFATGFIVFAFVLLFLWRHRKRIANNFRPATLSAKMEVFRTPGKYWIAYLTAFGIFSLVVFVLSLVVYFDANPHMVEYWPFPVITFLAASSVIYFIGVMSYYEHKNDFFKINAENIEFQIGKKHKQISARDLSWIRTTKKQYEFRLKDDNVIHVNKNMISSFECFVALQELIEQFGIPNQHEGRRINSTG